MASKLTQELRDAEKLGLAICGKAANEIERLQRQVAELESAASTSRAETMAVAHAEAVKAVNAVRDELRSYSSSYEDGPFPDEVIADALRLIEDFQARPDARAQGIIQRALRADQLQADLNAVDDRAIRQSEIGKVVSEHGPFGHVEIETSTPVVTCQHWLGTSMHVYGEPNGKITIQAYGRALEAFQRLLHDQREPV